MDNLSICQSTTPKFSDFVLVPAGATEVKAAHVDNQGMMPSNQGMVPERAPANAGAGSGAVR